MFRIIRLEDRIVLEADVANLATDMGAAFDCAAPIPSQDGAEPSDHPDGQHLLIISEDLSQADFLEQAAAMDTAVLHYDPSAMDLSSLLDAISQALDGEAAESIGFATHSRGEGGINLFDDLAVNADTLVSNVDLQDFFLNLGQMVNEDGRVDFLACNAGKDADLEGLLEGCLGRNAALSDDPTGNADDGGDWVLESDGVDLAATYFAPSALDGFEGVLGDIQNLSLISSNAFWDEGNNDSLPISQMSKSGRYVVFASEASDLVGGDTNGDIDVFIKDLWTGGITRVSTDSDGYQVQGDSYDPSISLDGRYVVFTSESNDLVSGDTNGALDVFVKDMQTGEVRLVSSNSSGEQGNNGSFTPYITGSNQFVVFASTASNLIDNVDGQQIYMKDLDTGILALVSMNEDKDPGNRSSYNPTASGDGRFVCFVSNSSNLHDISNSDYHVYVRDMKTGVMHVADTDENGILANDDASRSKYDRPSISVDGMWIVFVSSANNLVAGDTNGYDDVFRKNGRYGWVDLVSYDTGMGASNGDAGQPWISGTGQFVVFQSWATNIVGGGTTGVGHVYIRDMESGGWYLASQSESMNQGNDRSESPFVSPDGQYFSYLSEADNLVAGDTNNDADIFRAENPFHPDYKAATDYIETFQYTRVDVEDYTDVNLYDTVTPVVYTPESLSDLIEDLLSFYKNYGDDILDLIPHPQFDISMKQNFDILMMKIGEVGDIIDEDLNQKDADQNTITRVINDIKGPLRIINTLTTGLVIEVKKQEYRNKIDNVIRLTEIFTGKDIPDEANKMAYYASDLLAEVEGVLAAAGSFFIPINSPMLVDALSKLASAEDILHSMISMKDLGAEYTEYATEQIDKIQAMRTECYSYMQSRADDGNPFNDWAE